MKKLVFLLAGLLLTGVTASATTTTKVDENTSLNRNFVRGYGNSFIFVEQGVEFAIFSDGQFDFNVSSYGPEFGANVNLGNVNISFNTGYDYNPYVQYDDYGAVIQIENVPIFYDFYGRITQAGNVNINYNGFNRISRVGGLYVHYNRFNRFDYCSGFINVYNRSYVYRPWHNYYAIPAIDFCIVYARPYRQYYTPARYTYYRPYRDNYRQKVRVNSRRNTIARNTSRRSDRYKQAAKPRRENLAARGTNSRVNKTAKSRRESLAARGTNSRVNKTTKPRVSRAKTINNSRPRVDRPSVSRRTSTVSRTERSTKRETPRVSKTSRRAKPKVSSQRSTNSRKKVATRSTQKSSRATQYKTSRSSKRTQTAKRPQSRAKSTRSKMSRSSKSRRSL